MKKFLLVICLLLSVSVLRAETSSMLELSVGGGWSSLGYKLDAGSQTDLTVKQPGSYGVTAHFGYGLMFCPYVGLGLGVDFSHYGATAQLSGPARWIGVADTDGEKYDHRTEVANWKDRQDIWDIEVPLTVYFRAPLPNRKAWFSAEVGAKVGIPVISNAKFSGDLEHMAEYEPWLLELANVRGHGFYSSSMSGSYDIQPKTTFGAFAKLGFETPLDEKERLFFFAHVYATYYFTKALDLPEYPAELGFRNDTDNPAMRDAHAFMEDYTSVMDTKLISGKVNPLAVGVEIGIRFRIEHPKCYPCRCMNN